MYHTEYINSMNNNTIYTYMLKPYNFVVVMLSTVSTHSPQAFLYKKKKVDVVLLLLSCCKLVLDKS